MSLFLWYKLQLLNLRTAPFCFKVISQTGVFLFVSPQDIRYLSRKVALFFFNLFVETQNRSRSNTTCVCFNDQVDAVEGLSFQTSRTPNTSLYTNLSDWAVWRSGDSLESPEPDVADEASRAASYARRGSVTRRRPWQSEDLVRSGSPSQRDHSWRRVVNWVFNSQVYVDLA